MIDTQTFVLYNRRKKGISMNNNTIEDVYQTLKQYQSERGYLPNYREIMQTLGIKSLATVKLAMDALKADGRIVGSGHRLGLAR